MQTMSKMQRLEVIARLARFPAGDVPAKLEVLAGVVRIMCDDKRDESEKLLSIARQCNKLLRPEDADDILTVVESYIPTQVEDAE